MLRWIKVVKETNYSPVVAPEELDKIYIVLQMCDPLEGMSSSPDQFWLQVVAEDLAAGYIQGEDGGLALAGRYQSNSTAVCN